MALLRFELPASLRGSIRMLLIGIFILSDCGLALSSCPGLRKLSNGRLFFRYGGIYVTFFCHPGFKRYGFPTSSCVSGRWTRAPPVCVAPGCPDVGNILHGSRTVLAGSSVVQFRCDSGFGLQGSPVLYCDGNNWNDTKPMCKGGMKMQSNVVPLMIA
ncbi:C4b-binding protein alpha chain-like [Scyliorhinus torazame]|uniref:C4b-binding protein alpha chain-like n=1 Tax=Scyliorhinus torazame TaxID=75743 RepID=UPI003B5B1B7F